MGGVRSSCSASVHSFPCCQSWLPPVKSFQGSTGAVIGGLLRMRRGVELAPTLLSAVLPPVVADLLMLTSGTGCCAACTSWSSELTSGTGYGGVI